MTQRDDHELESREPDEPAEDDPTAPGHRDYDLSTASPYAPHVPPPNPWFMRRVALILVAIVVIIGLFVPYLRNIF